MSGKEPYKVMVSLHAVVTGSDDKEFPNRTIEFTFDGTDSTVDDMLKQYECFTAALGYAKYEFVVKNR